MGDLKLIILIYCAIIFFFIFMMVFVRVIDNGITVDETLDQKYHIRAYQKCLNSMQGSDITHADCEKILEYKQ